MKIYRYSAHPPEFYRFKGINTPRGIGCGPVAEDPGLWNIAWLSMEKQFSAYETSADPKDLPMWTPRGLDFILDVGNAVVDGQRFKKWAMQATANELLAMFIASTPTVEYPHKGMTWDSWLAFAQFRARTSADAIVSALEFKAAKNYSEMLKEASQSGIAVKQLPPPEPPVFTTTIPGEEIDFDAWLNKLKSGTVH